MFLTTTIIFSEGHFNNGVLVNVPDPTRHNIWMNKSDVNFFDIIKLFSKTWCNKRQIFVKFFNKKTKLNHSTKSNLIRILKNSQMIA